MEGIGKVEGKVTSINGVWEGEEGEKWREGEG